MINQQLAELSNLAIVVTIVLYVLALIGFGADRALIAVGKDGQASLKSVLDRSSSAGSTSPLQLQVADPGQERSRLPFFLNKVAHILCHPQCFIRGGVNSDDNIPDGIGMTIHIELIIAGLEC